MSCAAARRSSFRCTVPPAKLPLPLKASEPAVVIRDLPDEGALTAALAERFDGQPTIVTLADPGGDAGRALLRAGVRGVVGRDLAADDLAAAIDAVSRGFIVLSDRRREAGESAVELTPRERDVLALLARGWSNKTIAIRLSLAENTVKFHVASIFAKLDATTRTQAVTIGVRRGLIMV